MTDAAKYAAAICKLPTANFELARDHEFALRARVAELEAELTRLRAEQSDRRKMRNAALEEAAMWHEHKAETTRNLDRCGWHMIAARGLRTLIDQPAEG